MRIPEISFEGIGTESKSFLKRLANGKLFLVKNVDLVLADDFEEVRIDFKGIKPEDGLNIEDVATLALLVRTIAQAGKRAIIKFPQLYQGRPSRIHRFLERLGFRSLFEGDSSKYSWLKNIQIDAPAGRMASLPLRSGITNYVPLRWFDMDDFDYDQSISIWKAHFTLKSDLDRQLRTVLQSHGFADLDTVDLLTKTMFLELGLNAVLHSQYKPGAGFGVFCGQVGESIDAKNKLRQPEITFCIADLGRGIPATLGDSYHKNPDWKDFHRQNKISEQSAIIRYAIDPNSTSRPELPSDHDAAGYRGLALVSSALQGRGDILIRSAGGAVRLTGRVDGTKASPRDSFRQCPIPGTQVVGRLRIKPRKQTLILSLRRELIFRRYMLILSVTLMGSVLRLATQRRRGNLQLKRFQKRKQLSLTWDMPTNQHEA